VDNTPLSNLEGPECAMCSWSRWHRCRATDPLSRSALKELKPGMRSKRFEYEIYDLQGEKMQGVSPRPRQWFPPTASRLATVGSRSGKPSPGDADGYRSSTGVRWKTRRHRYSPATDIRLGAQVYKTRDVIMALRRTCPPCVRASSHAPRIKQT